MWNELQLYWRPGATPLTPSAATETTAPEWLVTNGIGGFASGTTFGHHTRRYHGWLVAALKPPVRRTLLWVKSEEQLILPDGRRRLSTNDYGDTIHPDGWKTIHSFRVYPFPTTVFFEAGILLERTIFMIYGQNTTAVIYRLLAGPPGLELRIEPLVNCRDYHHTVRASEWAFHQQTWGHGVEIRAHKGAPPLVMAAGVVGEGGAAYEPDGAWYYRFHYALERERGLDCVEDHFRPGTFSFTLTNPGQVAVLVGHCPEPVATQEPPWRAGPHALAEWVLDRYARAAARRAHVVEQALGARRHAPAEPDPDWLRLVLAADDFIAYRDSTGSATIMAGYPWFADWGRDAMISLPGLLLRTGRFDTAREVLLTFASHRSQGLIPNRFPDDGGEPLFNTADASLWWIYAAMYYWRATGDERTVKDELFPVMVDIVRSYLHGTRHGIGVDGDGLVRAADPGLQLTWMDAKAGDWVVTPRHGAPVEINALWYNALRSVEKLAAAWAPEETGEWTRLADRVGRVFRRRFIRQDGALYDVVAPRTDEKHGPLAAADKSIRPNQIIAGSLPFSPLTRAEARQVVHRVAEELLTPVGLRTLTPADKDYHGVYVGDQRARDGAYHQGTVWPWLLGPYVTAAPSCTSTIFDGLRFHLRHEAALGHVSEIFDGDAPHTPRGCFAQAWSVAEWLRVWQ